MYKTMYKHVISIFIILLLGTIAAAQTKSIPMPDLVKPDTIFFDENQMYITEHEKVYIYSTKDFKLIKVFGKKGEGPQEFLLDPTMPGLYLSKQGDDILVQSFGKISRWNTKGIYKSETRLPNPYILYLQALGDNLVGRKLILGKERWQAITVYNKSFKNPKEIYRVKHLFQPGQGTHTMNLTPPAVVYQDKLFTLPGQTFTINVYDQNGKELYSIKRNEKKRPVTSTDKKKIINFYKTNPLTKDYFQVLKPFFFPENYPAIKNFAINGDRIYVITYHENKKGHKECLVLDLKGNLLKRTHVPVTDSQILQLSPFAVHNGAIHQLTEDIDEEEWSLNITKVL